MRADPATEREVLSVLDNFFDDLANRRLEETLAAFAPDADVALYGSEVSEVVIGPDALRSFFGRLYERGGPRFVFRQRRLSSSGSVAWFVADAEVALGPHVASPYRLSGVLEKRGGRWLWMLFNGSEPQPNRVLTASFAPP